MTMDSTLAQFIHIGVIQFGQFAVVDRPGVFAPIAFNLGLLASYPSILRAAAVAIAPLTQIDGLTHLLATSTVIPLGTAISQVTGLPLLYPSALDPDFIEGAYDYDVPTVLLTGVLTDGFAERALIRRTKSAGLDVKAIVTVFDLYNNVDVDGVALLRWRSIRNILPAITTPSLRETVERWVMGHGV